MERKSIDLIIAAMKKNIEPPVVKMVEILKEATDTEKRLVTGIVLKPDVPDGHGDIMTADEIEKTAHGFMLHYRNMGEQHENKADAVPVESYIAPVDMNIAGRAIAKGTWLITSKVLSESLWYAIKAGHYTAYSAGGYAQRQPRP